MSKRDAVALALSSGKTATEVARDLSVSPERLRGWVKQAKVDRGEGVRSPRRHERQAVIPMLGRCGRLSGRGRKGRIRSYLA
ncbi:transposase [Streptomyces sp. NPDC002701]|uniref:transposase n=1 Tax=Streptomyces sp. NPDC002701 TaxID=3364661 RepID=UPI00368823E5